MKPEIYESEEEFSIRAMSADEMTERYPEIEPRMIAIEKMWKVHELQSKKHKQLSENETIKK